MAKDKPTYLSSGDPTDDAVALWQLLIVAINAGPRLGSTDETTALNLLRLVADRDISPQQGLAILDKRGILKICMAADGGDDWDDRSADDDVEDGTPVERRKPKRRKPKPRDLED